MNNNLDNFLKTLRSNNLDLSELVNFEEIFNKVNKLKSQLGLLNTLFTNDYDVFYNKLQSLYKCNKEILLTLPNLLAIRNSEFKISNFDELLDFFNKSGLTKLIIENRISNFSDYFIGIEVGLSVNKRKNIVGKKIEDTIFKHLKEYYSDFKYIKIYEQTKINEIIQTNNSNFQSKIFDFIIFNENNQKYLLIESSFYNSQGSKISETHRSYFDLYKEVKAYSPKFIFCWIADGKGMRSIKNQLNDTWDYEYIYNLDSINEALKKIF